MSQDTTHCLFEEAYWLDAIAPGEWQASEVNKDGVLIGRLPYIIRRKHGFTSIGPGHFTNWLSPWIKPSGGKPTTELSNQHQVLEELVQQLPRAERAIITSAPEYTNLMALHWAGFQLRYGYTHRLDVQALSETELWDGLRDTVRRQIRKAEKIATVTTNRTVDDFATVLLKTFDRQGIDVTNTIPALRRIDAVMAPRDQRRIFTAEDQYGNIHAAVYVVFDHRHVFYIAGGGDPAFRQSGGHSLAMWRAIQDARAHAPVFDFVGSMVPGIEYFVRGFGPRQVPRMMAEKYQGIGRIARALQVIRGAL
jgi:hypothetical protein